jgi:hypothetical protein
MDKLWRQFIQNQPICNGYPELRSGRKMVIDDEYFHACVVLIKSRLQLYRRVRKLTVTFRLP